jgi:hypothetical protein
VITKGEIAPPRHWRCMMSSWRPGAPTRSGFTSPRRACHSRTTSTTTLRLSTTPRRTGTARPRRRCTRVGGQRGRSFRCRHQLRRTYLPALRPHPTCLLCARILFAPARGGGSLLGRVTAHRGGAGRRYWSGSNPTHVPRRGGGGEPPPPSVDLGLTGGRPITWPAETVAEPLPHAHLLGLQAYSLHLPVPQLQHIVDAGGSLRRGIDGDGGGGAAAGPDAVLSGAEEGLAVQLPLPAAWRAALNSSSGTNIDVEGHARTMPEPSIENWVVPTTDVPVLSKRQRRRARRARRKAQSGLPKRASTFSA